MITTYAGKNLDSQVSVIVIHGSMQMKFDQFHPLVQYYQAKFKTVYSIELPGHGSQQQYEDVSKLTVQEIVDTIYQQIEEICPRENLFVTSYSVGGILFMKMWERLHQRNKDLKGIFIGTGIKISPESESIINNFFSEETYKKLGWENLMIRQHGPNWKKTLKLTNKMFKTDSDIFPSENELSFLKQESEKNNIFFILGKQDQPFKIIDFEETHNFKLFEIEGDHFSYFIEKKSWPIVKEIIEKEVVNWFPK